MCLCRMCVLTLLVKAAGMILLHFYVLCHLLCMCGCFEQSLSQCVLGVPLFFVLMAYLSSHFSAPQLLLESKEMLVAAYEIKMYYNQLVEASLPYLPTRRQRQLEISQVSFEQDLKKVLEVCFSQCTVFAAEVQKKIANF